MIPLIPWGGSVLGMIISLKNNARPRRKPFEAQKDHPIGHRSKKKRELHFKKVSAEKLSETRKNIREKIKRDERKYYLKITGISLIVCALIFGIVYANDKKNNEIQKRNIEIRKQNKDMLMQQEQSLSPADFDAHMTDGIYYLKKGKYRSAHKSFSQACIIQPDDYRANMGLCASKIYICLQTGENCQATEDFLIESMAKFGRRKDLVKLEEKFYSEIDK